jgi:hypothetical protein
MEPIYRVQRRDDAAPAVERVVAQRLLTPQEREEARRRREAKRAEVAKRTTSEKRTQDRENRTDHFA